LSKPSLFKMSITLPNDMANVVKSRVQADEYAKAQ
jgi:Arc/MetJ-type ribon-helix-helix transcriptional regulator